jgi:hypothetical protein
MSFTFALDDVETDQALLERWKGVSCERHETLASSTQELAFKFSAGRERILAKHEPSDYLVIDFPEETRGRSLHPFMATLAEAFNNHFPLLLSPDHVWAVIMQGFGLHIHQNAEALRAQFVEHQGKKELTVRDDRLAPGSPVEAWRETLKAFASQIGGHIGEDRVELLCPTFTTTGGVEAATFRTLLMGAFKDYFSYGWEVLCGIPSITLAGEPSDWVMIRDRIEALRRYDLDWWIDPLGVVCDELVKTAKGEPDLTFWRSMVRESSMSGATWWDGWVCNFFPYLYRADVEMPRNPMLRTQVPAAHEMQDYNGMVAEDFPCGMTRVEGTYSYMGAISKVELLSGFVGTRRDEATSALTPVLGWALRFAG